MVKWGLELGPSWLQSALPSLHLRYAQRAPHPAGTQVQRVSREGGSCAGGSEVWGHGASPLSPGSSPAPPAWPLACALPLPAAPASVRPPTPVSSSVHNSPTPVSPSSSFSFQFPFCPLSSSCPGRPPPWCCRQAAVAVPGEQNLLPARAALRGTSTHRQGQDEGPVTHLPGHLPLPLCKPRLSGWDASRELEGAWGGGVRGASHGPRST